MNSMSGEKLKGIPYTGTLPATLTGTKAGYLHKYKIYGNTEQTGTPTPSDPIVPQECGERTENEAWTGWAQDFVTRINDSTKARFETIDGRTCLWYDAAAGYGEYDNKYIFKTDWKENTQYTVSFDALRLTTETAASVFRIRYTDGTYENLPFSKNSGEFESYTLTSQENKTIQYIISRYTSGQFRIDIDTFMVNEGSTALPYEPYGYKIPLLSGSTPVDIYIGESQTIRRIKKLVLTGEEASWRKAENSSVFYRSADDYPMISGVICVCTHYAAQENVTSANNVNNNCVTFSRQQFSRYYIRDDSISTLDDFKTFLQQQYANGTPVTTWYVLATPKTAVVNEPLRKIGNYADTIESTQTSAQIPTTANSTTISWGGSGLAPSQFDSIQEWVDIPTYTRVNGEWVADN